MALTVVFSVANKWKIWFFSFKFKALAKEKQRVLFSSSAINIDNIVRQPNKDMSSWVVAEKSWSSEFCHYW